MNKHHDITKQIDSWLTQRGLSQEEIHCGMMILIGEDWDQVGVSELFDRLKVKGIRVSNDMSLFADDLEAFVRGALKLGDLYSSWQNSVRGVPKRNGDCCGKRYSIDRFRCFRT